MMNNDEFYRECARLLQCEHVGEAFPYHKRTRWNNRKAGRGRFPNHGIIRVFGDIVHVSLHTPRIDMQGSKEEVLKQIEESMSF